MGIFLKTTMGRVILATTVITLSPFLLISLFEETPHFTKNPNNSKIGKSQYIGAAEDDLP